MAQLPEFLRPSRAAVSVPQRSGRDRLAAIASILSWLAALVLCAVGVFAMVRTVLNAPAAQVHVVGTHSQLERQLLQQSLTPWVKTGYFRTDLAQLRDAALAFSWVDRVTVSRHWPNGMVVRVLPHHAVARWGSGRLLSDQGVVFSEAAPQNHRDLPLLHGAHHQSKLMMQQYQQINQWFVPLGLRLRELHLTDRMTWFMQFDNGLRVIVDQEQTQAKLQQLSVLAKTGLKPAWPQIAAIDLRYRNGLALQWKSGRAPLLRAGAFVIAPKVDAPAAGAVP